MVAAQIPYAGVAQAVEQQTFNLVVGGSIPPTRTKKINKKNPHYTEFWVDCHPITGCQLAQTGGET